MIKLDKKTKSILYELDRNSRQSNTQLAKTIGLSKDVVNYRIQKLESGGIIQHYAAIINTKKIGFQSMRVVLTLTSASPKQQQDLIDYLLIEENVFFVSQYKSSADIVFGYISKNSMLLQKYIDELKLNYSSFIETIDFAFYDVLHHLHRNYLTGLVVDETNVIDDDEFIEPDDLDISILKQLAKNARVSVTYLANLLKKPITTIISRIKHLEKKRIILGYTIMLSVEKLGLEYYKLELKLDDQKKQSSLLEFCRQQPEITYYMKTIGNWDVEIFVEIESATKLHLIIESIQEQFLVRKMIYRSAMRYYKFRYF